jgi:NADH-quinone oxidoreductase chain I
MYGAGIAMAFVVTLKNFFRKPTTVQYPEERLPQHPRFRGEEFVWYEERCTGCASCAKACPLGIIRIVTHPSEQTLQEGDNYAIDIFDIDIGRCMFCALCVEACPYDALFMGSGFERGAYDRNNLVIDVDELRKADKRPSTWFRPQLEMRKYDPQKLEPLGWRDVGREASRWHKGSRPKSEKPPIEGSK